MIQCIATQDGTWIARCTRTGVSASGPSQAEAEAECRRLATAAKRVAA